LPDFHFFSIEQKNYNLKQAGKLSDNDTMKRYNVKCHNGRREFIDILKELDSEYVVRFTRQNEGREKTTEETITKNLFDMCLQTGYFYQNAESSAA
jgi:hypothetical protein